MQAIRRSRTTSAHAALLRTILPTPCAPQPPRTSSSALLINPSIPTPSHPNPILQYPNPVPSEPHPTIHQPHLSPPSQSSAAGVAVVNAAGPWFKALNDTAFLELTTSAKPIRIQVAHKWIPDEYCGLPFVADGWGPSGIYFMPRAKNNQLVIGSIDAQRFVTATTSRRHMPDAHGVGHMLGGMRNRLRAHTACCARRMHPRCNPTTRMLPATLRVAQI